MKKLLLLTIMVAAANFAGAQGWEFHLATGLGFGKLIPMEQSTPRSRTVHYGFSVPGMYFSPEACLRLNEHSRFSIGYQVSGTRVGLQFLPNGRRGAKEESYDIITLHNFSVGYSYKSLSRNERVQKGFFAKVGIAYGQLTGVGGGGGSGVSDPNGYYMSSNRETEFEVIPDFWAPTTTIGFILGPNAKKGRIADRLVFTVAANVVWKNPYVAYSKIEYAFMTSTSTQSGVVQYQGMPMSVQLGMDYRLFKFGKKDK